MTKSTQKNLFQTEPDRPEWEIAAEEDRLVADIASKLRADGLVFVGLDLIGGRMTEINVTSPTGIRELGRLSGTTPSDRVIDWVEGQVEQLGS